MASRIRNGGFTLVELLVVIGIIAILAGLIFPALGRAKSRATRISCLSNYRQLTLAFMSYVDDANGYLPPNETEQTGGRDGLNSTARTWVRGNAYADSTPTNVQMGVLFPYNQSVAIYRCPSDRSSVRDERRIRRTRSVSMNMFLNTVLEPSHPLYSSCWHRVDQILHPPPSNVFVFIDEHEDSIDNARFAMAQPDRWTWIDFPAVRHDRAASLSFADGHAEIWTWRSPVTLETARRGPWIQFVRTPLNDPDLTRISGSVPVLP